MPEKRFDDIEGRSIKDILRIGRSFQDSDRVYRGATYETAKLLCDTIEMLNEALEREKNRCGGKLRSGYWSFLRYDCACCSVCGGLHTTPFDTTSEAKEKWNELYRYCPYCGAFMEYVKPDTKWSKSQSKKGNGHER